MTAAALLDQLRGRGVRLWVEGSNLRFSAPKGSLGPAAAEQLARHKAELIRLLTEGDGRAASRNGSARRPSGFSLENEPLSLADVKDWVEEEQDPYVRFVAPYKGFLYQRLGVDKKYVRGEGCYLYDEQGERYADFIAQYGAVPFGHDPEAIWKAVDAVRVGGEPNFVNTSVLGPAGELAERLLDVAPGGMSYVAFTNSGAEAVEAALKLARSRTGRLGILSARNAFHGLTLGGMSATGKDFYQRGFGAPVLGFDYVPFGDLQALEAALALRPDFYAAFIVEPIQGEGGIHVAPPGYLSAAGDLCRRFGVLLILDEVQTGLGRTGRLFACDGEGVSPDIITLAKAMGGGLIPVGACLYARSAYTEHFDVRHSSTFAANTLACRVGLAVLGELLRDGRHLIAHVEMMGRRLEGQLQGLRREFPDLVADVRGRGFMYGLELDLTPVGSQSGLLACLQGEGLLLHLVVSYLLNVTHVRIAPSFTSGTVLRIEPPLVADEAICDHLIDSLYSVLGVLRGGDAGRLLSHLMRSCPLADAAATPAEPRAVPGPADAPGVAAEEGSARFAFVVHLLDDGDLRRLDSSLEPFEDEELGRLKSRFAEFIGPFAVGNLLVESPQGARARGELILLPFSAEELMELPGEEAVGLVQRAVELAAERGAEVVGLGGFSSIVADGGLAISPRAGVRVTSGNSLTTWAILRAVEAACAERGVSLAGSTVAIVGATGAIGQALSLLFAEHAKELILVGNPRAPEASTRRLWELVGACRRRLTALAAAGKGFAPDALASRLVGLNGRPDEDARDLEPWLTVTTDVDRHLPKADIVLTATNSVRQFISASHLREGALVCDASRPFNVVAGLMNGRRDVRVLEGGLVRAPGEPALGPLAESGQRAVLPACAAETIVLALSGYCGVNLCGRVELSTMENLGRLAEELGFTVALVNS